MGSYKEYKEYSRRNGLPIKTWWEWKKFEWFGDGGAFIWMMYGQLFLSLLCWGLTIWVVTHFIIKYW